MNWYEYVRKYVQERVQANLSISVNKLEQLIDESIAGSVAVLFGHDLKRDANGFKRECRPGTAIVEQQLVDLISEDAIRKRVEQRMASQWDDLLNHEIDKAMQLKAQHTAKKAVFTNGREVK